ncbi:MAG: sensor histidine kinase [Gammaproteobacteria bacterium]
MKQKLALGVGAVLVVLLADGVLSYRATRALIDANAWVAHSHEVIEEIEATLSTVKDAETGQRGYLITGEEIYLEPYREALGDIDRQIGRLRQLTVDNPVQQRWIAHLDSLILDRLAILDTGLSLRREQGFEAARQWTLTGRGREAMADMRTHIDKMKTEERGLLFRRIEESRESGRKALIGLTIETVLALFLVLLVSYLIRRDLRERERAERALRAAHDELERRVQERTQELERSNRELQDFAFIASHDLQEPLRKIQTFGDRLKAKHGEALEAQGRDYLERMQNAARRMHRLINDLLTFSRVAAKAQPFVPVALEEVAREVLGDLEARIEETGGQVEVGELPTVEADPLQMRQVLQNLIGNALKFHYPEQPPRVQVRGAIIDGSESAAEGTATDGICQIAVEDNGIGIDEKYQDKIFTPFQRLHGRGEYEGTGMGLAVCRKIVERHGGTITFTSTPGSGTIFLVTLPLTHHEGGQTV